MDDSSDLKLCVFRRTAHNPFAASRRDFQSVHLTRIEYNGLISFVVAREPESLPSKTPTCPDRGWSRAMLRIAALKRGTNARQVTL
jgi:hypothetical protein